MVEQRTITIAQLSELGEVWISSSDPFSRHLENFKQAEGMLAAMKRQDKIWDYEVHGDKAVAITPLKSNGWPNIEDMVLQHFLPGVAGVETDIAVYDRGAEEPRRRFKVTTDDKTKARSMHEIHMTSA